MLTKIQQSHSLRQFWNRENHGFGAEKITFVAKEIFLDQKEAKIKFWSRINYFCSREYQILLQKKKIFVAEKIKFLASGQFHRKKNPTNKNIFYS